MRWCLDHTADIIGMPQRRSWTARWLEASRAKTWAREAFFVVLGSKCILYLLVCLSIYCTVLYCIYIYLLYLSTCKVLDSFALIIRVTLPCFYMALLPFVQIACCIGVSRPVYPCHIAHWLPSWGPKGRGEHQRWDPKLLGVGFLECPLFISVCCFDVFILKWIADGFLFFKISFLNWRLRIYQSKLNKIQDWTLNVEFVWCLFYHNQLQHGSSQSHLLGPAPPPAVRVTEILPFVSPGNFAPPLELTREHSFQTLLPSSTFD